MEGAEPRSNWNGHGKLISYAHGREITLADRPHIDEVYTSVAQNDFSLRATIHAIVAHPAFGKK